jgi:hypothetical protein
MTDQTPVPPPPPPPPAGPTTTFPAAAAQYAGPPPPPGPPPVANDHGGRGGRKLIVGGIVAALVLGGGYGAYAVYDNLDGGGPQPHDVLPASTDAYLRLDLDPSAGQKVDLFKLIRKVPDLADEVGITSDKSDIRKLVFKDILASECDDLDYDKDVEPWLGDRIGVGFDIDAKQALVAVQTKDEGKSRAGIKQLFECANDTYGIAYLDGYAIVTPKQADADKAVTAAKKSSLGDNKTFTADFDQIGNQGVASGWANLEALAKVPEISDSLGEDADELSKAGTAAMALRADGSAIELAVLGGPATGGDKATNLAKLPDDTVAALSIAGLGDQVTKGFDAFVEEFDKEFSGGPFGSGAIGSGDTGPDDDLLGNTGADADPISAVPTAPAPTVSPDDLGPDDDFGLDDDFGDDPGGFGTPGASGAQGFIDELERETGFRLPEDLATLFGDSLTLAIGSENLEKIPTLSGPEGVSALNIALALTSDKAAALDLVQRFAQKASEGGVPLVASPTDDGAVLATNQDAADAIADPDGSLGDSKTFKSVIPDGDGTYGGLYIDIGTILDKVLEADPPADVRKGIESASALSAIGVSASKQDDDRSLTRLRISFR